MTASIDDRYQAYVDEVGQWMARAQTGKAARDRTDKEVKRLLVELKNMIGEEELERTQPRQKIVELKKQMNEFRVNTLKKLENMDFREVIGSDEETDENNSADLGNMQAGNAALRGALKDVELGKSHGINIQENLARQNDKMRHALNTNGEIYGDLGLGNSLINDIERRRLRDRMICKIAFLLAATIVTVLLILKHFLHR